jgi:hypothetical protein
MVNKVLANLLRVPEQDVLRVRSLRQCTARVEEQGQGVSEVQVNVL